MYADGGASTVSGARAVTERSDPNPKRVDTAGAGAIVMRRFEAPRLLLFRTCGGGAEHRSGEGGASEASALHE